MDLSLLVDKNSPIEKHAEIAIDSKKRPTEDSHENTPRKKRGRPAKNIINPPNEVTVESVPEPEVNQEETVIPGNIKLPNNWEHVPRRGKRLREIPFIPCKTLVRSDLVDEEYVFDASMLADQNICAYIDLTSNNAYHDPKELLKYKIAHVKIPCDDCSGTCQTPTRDTIQQFISAADQFVKKFPNKAIMVADSFGYNYSGFLICCHLVEKMDWSLGASVATFRSGRQPGIFDRVLLNSLYELYDDTPDPSKYPFPPKWARKGGRSDSPAPREERAGSNSPDVRQTATAQPVSVGYQPAGFTPSFGFTPVMSSLDVSGYDMADCSNYEDYLPPGVTRELPKSTQPDAVASVNSTIDEQFQYGTIVKRPHLERLQDACYKLLQSKEFPGFVVLELTEDSLSTISWMETFVTWKPVGVEYLMMIIQEGVFLVNSNYNIFHVKLKFLKPDGSPLTKTLLKGDLVEDKQPDGSVLPRFLLTDLLVFQGAPLVGTKRFDKRLGLIANKILAPRKKINVDSDPFRMRIKFHLPAKSGLSKLMDSILPTLPHKYEYVIIHDFAKDKIYRWNHNDETEITRDMILKHIPS